MKGTMAANSNLPGTLQRKYSFSHSHLIAARHLANLAAHMEQERTPETITEPEKAHHRAYVVSAVILSVAFLEASINELYLEAGDKTPASENPASLQGLTEQQIQALAALWQVLGKLKGGNPLSKYQAALTVCGVELFDPGGPPYQGTAGLINLRNTLVHAKPEWEEIEETPHKEKKLSQKIQKDLKSYVKTLNPFAGPKDMWFPDKCLGAGCAQWAVKQVEEFMNKFCTKLGIPSRLPPAG